MLDFALVLVYIVGCVLLCMLLMLISMLIKVWASLLMWDGDKA